MQDLIYTTILIIAPIAIVLLLLILHFRARKMILDWAVRHDYKIIQLNHKVFWKGPFNWGSSRGQRVYYVRLQVNNEKMSNAYIRCGSFWKGTFEKKLEVVWDEDFKKL